MTQPVWPVQCSTSSPASFSGRNGSPALPKIDSTKSRLLTRPPGAKKRISIVFPASQPGTAGQTIGRSSSETNVADRLRPVGGERQGKHLARRFERPAEQARRRPASAPPSCRRGSAGPLRRRGTCRWWCGGRCADCAARRSARGRNGSARCETSRRPPAATARGPGRGDRASASAPAAAAPPRRAGPAKCSCRKLSIRRSAGQRGSSSSDSRSRNAPKSSSASTESARRFPAAPGGIPAGDQLQIDIPP